MSKVFFKNKAEIHRVMTGSDYSIAILSETWTQENFEDSNKYNMSGFHFIPHSRNDGYGGAGILLTNNLSYTRIPLTGMSRLTQAVSIHVNYLDIVVTAVYVSPSITAAEFENDMHFIFTSLRNLRRIIIGGDFNAHHFGWGDGTCDKKGEIVMEKVNQSGLLILNDGSPTYVPLQLNHRSSAIDISLCSTDLVNSLGWSTLDYGIGSHHKCVKICWMQTRNIQSGYFYDKKAINECISKLDTAEVRSVQELQKCVKRIYKVNKKKDRRSPKFWWSDDVDAAWKEKNEARKNFNRIASMENLLEFKRKAALFQRKKREEIRNKFEELPNEVGPFVSSKELWQKVGRLTGKRTHKKENNIIFDDEASAQLFLDTHFGCNDPQLGYTTGLVCTTTLLDKNNWYRILDSKKKKSAPGEDNLTYEMIRSLQPDVTETIIRNINEMWRRGCLDDSLKNIKVVAIPKPGRDQSTPSGKRPISLVPTLTKVANTAVLEQLQNTLILPENSFGFRKGLSTNTCISFVTNWIKESKRNHMVTGLICIDLSNAFNAVRTDTLEVILSGMGVSHEILMWISSFLKNRKVSLHIREKVLSRTISNGLPQGDVLSPTLFNAYTAKLHDIKKHGVILVQYADDFGILVRAKNLELLNTVAQEYLDEFSEKAECLNFTVNAEKTKALLFQNNDKELNITINGTKIETVRNHRYLGITIDRYLSFGAHIREVREKIQQRLNMVKILSGAKSGAHPDTMTRIYIALCRSIMEYGCSIFNNAKPSNRRIMSVINNQGLRKITGTTKTTPLNALAALSGQEPLEFRHEYVTMREIARHVTSDDVIAKQLKNTTLPEDVEKWDTFTYLERVYWTNKELFEAISPLTNSADTEVSINPYLEDLQTAKKNNDPVKLKQLALFVMNGRNKGKGRIFTDASKEGTICGIGVFVENIKRRVCFKLSRETSVTSAELIAIQQATRIIEQEHLQNYVIYTDSKSACIMLITALESKTKEGILADILTCCQRWNISIQWIPSHVSISGNETADMLAKNGVNSDNVLHNKILLKDAFLNAKTMMEKRTRRWYESYSEEKGKNFFSSQPEFYTASWFKDVDMKGSDIKLINRLMVGHDYSKYWLTRMKILDDSDCEICAEPETSEHLILHCPRLGMLRMQFSFDNRFATLSDLFKTRNESLFKEVVKFIRIAKLDL